MSLNQALALFSIANHSSYIFRLFSDLHHLKTLLLTRRHAKSRTRQFVGQLDQKQGQLLNLSP